MADSGMNPSTLGLECRVNVHLTQTNNIIFTKYNFDHPTNLRRPKTRVKERDSAFEQLRLHAVVLM